MAKKSPNILLIMADQLAPHFTGAYGHDVVKTPNLDALAARGATFDAAYCNSPLCAPSRCSFMAGQFISKTKTFDNASEFPASVPTFAHYLRQMGYRTCLSGKMHFVGPDQLHGFDERVTTDIYPSDYAWTPDWENPDERIDKWYHNMQTVKESGEAVATFQIDYDDEVGYAARRKLFDYARDGIGSEQPFCMVASFIHPHDPYVARPEWWNLYSDDDIDLPKHPMTPDEQDPMGRRLMDGYEATTTPLTEEEVRRARRAYYANVSYFDSKIGLLVQALKDTGQLDNTVIMITADHGDMLGERGLWYKMSMFEHSARVPLIMAGPGIKQGRIADPASLVDILPTMLDIAATDGTSQPKVGQALDGRSVWPEVTTGSSNPEAEAVCEYCAEMTGHPVLMIRRGVMKYVHCDSDPAQLFNVQDDPHELTNLSGDPAYAEVEAAFAAEVQERWNTVALRDEVIAAQHQRRAVYDAMQHGVRADWDYNPPRDASMEYVRNHMDWTVAAAKYRFPRV